MNSRPGDALLINIYSRYSLLTVLDSVQKIDVEKLGLDMQDNRPIFD